MDRESLANRLRPLAGLLTVALLLTTAGCGGPDPTAGLEQAYQDWVAFAAARPAGDTAADREARAETLKAEALRLLAGTNPEGLKGNAAFYAGSLFQAAGTHQLALSTLEPGLPGLDGEKADLARMAAAAAALGAGRDIDTARGHLMEVTDRKITPTVTGSWGSIICDLVEACEEERRWDDALPLLELVRDSGDDKLAPPAARWIAYIHRDAGHEKLAAEAARDAMARFPDDANLNTRMTNFIHQHGLVDQPLPELPAMSWIGTAAEKTTLAGLMRDKVMLIDLWAPWCPPCRASFPFLRDLRERHGEQGLQVVGLTRLYGYYEDEKERVDDAPPEQELELITTFAGSHQLEWPVGVAAEGDTLFATLGVAGIPNFILIDREGVVRGTFLGETGPVKRQIEELAVSLLQQ